MLIISRKAGESIIINEDIEIVLLDIQGEKLKIGINAPPSVKIMRKELLETEQANKEAANVPDTVAVGKLREIFKNMGG